MRRPGCSLHACACACTVLSHAFRSTPRPSLPPTAPPPPVEEPEALQCPVTRELFRDPATNTQGSTYERAAIERHYAGQQRRGVPLRDPMTNVDVASDALVPNLLVHQLVGAFLAAHPSHVPDGWPSREQPRLTLAAAPAAAAPPADEREPVDGETLARLRANDEEVTLLEASSRVTASAPPG
jgi:hypothetical protein